MIIKTEDELKAASILTVLYIMRGDDKWGLTWEPTRGWWLIHTPTERNDWYDDLPKWVREQLPTLKGEL